MVLHQEAEGRAGSGSNRHDELRLVDGANAQSAVPLLVAERVYLVVTADAEDGRGPNLCG